MRTKFGWLIVLGVLVAAGLAIGWEKASRARLRRDLSAARDANNGLARLRAENKRLAALQPSASELDDLRADHAAIPHLRAEIDALREQVKQTEEKTAAPVPERFAAGSKVTAAEWKNAGAATPQATLETMLWAAAGGDIDAFASGLFLGRGRLRQQAVALLESLPADRQAQYGTPERLIAMLAIRDVPLGASQVVAWNEVGGATRNAFVQLDLSAPDGTTKEVNLWFMSQGGAGWKLTVPDSAIAKYAAQLKAPAVVAEPAKLPGRIR